VHVEFRQQLTREQFERLADMVVPVLAALLDEGDLIDTRILEALELLGRADPARSGGLRQRGPSPFISRPDIGTAVLVLAENIVMRQRVAEELESILAARPSTWR